MGSSTWYDFCVHIFPLPNPIWVFVFVPTLKGWFFSQVPRNIWRPEAGRKGDIQEPSRWWDIPCPASTAFSGSANPVLHRFCHSTIFCRSMMHSLDVRKHVLKARGSLLFALITNHASPLGPITRHVTRTKTEFVLWVSFFSCSPSPLDSAFRFRSPVVCFFASAPTCFPTLGH